jgi:hypothetical protein
MADDLKQTGRQDDERINVAQASAYGRSHTHSRSLYA